MSNNTTPSEQSYQKLNRPSGEVLAYRRLSANSQKNLPGLIFLPGFMSDMDGAKALTIENFALIHRQNKRHQHHPISVLTAPLPSE